MTSTLAMGMPAISAGKAAAPSKPNILVIETDDQTAESMRVMQNVNSLIGDRGVTFRNSFVNYSLCCPSRATFLTGQYAHNHGVLGNRWPSGGYRRFEASYAYKNLAVWLRHAGYYTGMVGKYLNEYKNYPLVPPGWSEWRVVAPDWLRTYDYTLNVNGTLVRYGEQPSDFKDDVLTGKAVDFVNRRAPKVKPFFLWLSYLAPHTSGPDTDPNPPADCDRAARPAPRHADSFDSEPLPMPPNFNEADVSDKPAAIRALPVMEPDLIAEIERRYRCELESLLSVDEGVKQVIGSLRATGALKDTLVIYTSDNGFFHGEHRVPYSKTGVYEESIRVPLQMRGPGMPPGKSVDPLVINADLAPTILEAASTRPRLVMDGRSLLPVIKDPTIDKQRDLLIEKGGSGPTFNAIRSERYVYVKHDTGERELYDLKRDPYELQSRHDDPAYAPVAAELASRLAKLRRCAGPRCLMFEPDPTPK